MLRLLSAIVLLAAAMQAQDRRARIDVENYKIDAEINGRTQSIVARAAVRFVPVDDNITSLTFELNNALNVRKVVDEQGTPLTPTRNQSDFTVRVNLPAPYPRGKPVTIVFDYDGHLTGEEESPIYGIKFAAIHEDFAYLLYPARWFPVSGYSTNRFTSEINVTVPDGYRVIGSGLDTSHHDGDKLIVSYKTTKPSFPGSIAISKAAPIKNTTDGVATSLFFRGPAAENANIYGAETAKIMNYFSGLFTIAPVANLTVFETEAGAPNGFSAPGIVFLNPGSIGREVNARVLANQCSRQWWETQVSPATRAHLWLENGLASYSESLWAEHNSGAGAMETQMKAASIEALTVDNIPVIQEARLEDYSPEYWAISASKGAEVLNMLRYVVGDQKFFQGLKTFATNYAWRSTVTDDLRQAMESAAQEDLRWFFLEWIESTGTPEFKLDYTVFRTTKGFRVQGKVTQDMDTFRMPVELKIETEGKPETKRVDVIGSSSEFSVDTFGKPKTITIDPDAHLLRMSDKNRLAIAIRKGEQFQEVGDFSQALREFQRALETNRNSSHAHFDIAQVHFLQNNYQSAANSYRECLNGDLDPKWTEVWAHIGLGKIFDLTGQRDRAVNEYTQAQRTRDNTSGAQDEASKYIKTPYERKRTDGN
jgi:tetratricopeptide (TPR) repeat protein